MHDGRLRSPITNHDERMIPEQVRQERDQTTIQLLNFIHQVLVGVVLHGAVQIDQLRVRWRGRELRVVRWSLDLFEEVRASAHHMQIGKDVIKVRCQDCMNPSRVECLEQVVVTRAGRNIGIKQAHEKLLPIFARMKQVL